MKTFIFKSLSPIQINQTSMVTWDTFFKQPLQNCLRPDMTTCSNDSDESSEEELKPNKPGTLKPATFSLWLHEIKQLCTPSVRTNKSGLPKYWLTGKIEGFISKTDLSEKLCGKEGRFMLYFSEALLGGLTVAWYDDKPARGES